MKRTLKNLAIWLLFIGIGILFIQPLTGDGDFFHHLNTGKYIFTQHAFPYRDIYTFTAHGLPWVAYAWGTGVIYYVLFTTLGPTGISLWISLSAVGTFAILYRYLRSMGISRAAALLGIIVAAAPVAMRWPNRPELVTYPAILLLLLIDEFSVKRPKVVYLWPLIILIWSNMYGSSTLFGLLFLGLLIVLRFIKKSNRDGARPYLSSFALSVLAAFLTPDGVRGVFYILYIPKIATIQGEWTGILDNLTRTPIDFRLSFQYRTIVYLIYLGITMISAVITILQRDKPWRLLFLATAVFIPIWIFRMIPLGVILSAPLVAYSFDHLADIPKRLMRILVVGATCVSIALAVWLSPPGLGVNTEAFPTDVITYLQAHSLAGNAFTSQQLGAFVSYYLYPKGPIYSDTRDDLFATTRVISDLYNTYATGKSIIPLLNKYKADLVIMDLSDGISLEPVFTSPDWVIVYLNSQYAIAVSKKIQEEKHLTPLDAIDPFILLTVKPNQEKEGLAQYQQVNKLHPDNATNQLRLASAYLATNTPSDALTVLSGLSLPQGPRKRLFAIADYTLAAQAHLMLGNCQPEKQLLDIINLTRRSAFLFSPDELLSTPVELDWALYYLRCVGDTGTAQTHLDRYLADPTVPVAGKTQAQDLFRQLQPR